MPGFTVSSTQEKTPFLERVIVIFRMVKFSHTIFALPVALMSTLIASGGWPPADKLFFIILAMIGARNGAMAFNRLVDIEFDRNNPRTMDRALPQGKLSPNQVKLFIVACSALFIGAAYCLGRLAFILSPFMLIVICFYSYTKRFTSYSHLFLGVALGLAPIGAWIGIRDSLSLIPVVLGLAVVFWVAGFDIIYACQDVEYDQNVGLHSIPQKFGLSRALCISAVFHLITILLLLWIKPLAQLGSFYSLGVLGVTSLLIYEHYLVRPHDLSRVDQAFCMVNAMVSIVLLFGTSLDYFL